MLSCSTRRVGYKSNLSGIQRGEFPKSFRYEAHDGWDDYCKFATLEKFIEGYWGFLERTPYAGWKEHAGTAQDFLGFIAPTYCPGRPGYAKEVLELITQVEEPYDRWSGP